MRQRMRYVTILSDHGLGSDERIQDRLFNGFNSGDDQVIHSKEWDGFNFLQGAVAAPEQVISRGES